MRGSGQILRKGLETVSNLPVLRETELSTHARLSNNSIRNVFRDSYSDVEVFDFQGDCPHEFSAVPDRQRCGGDELERRGFPFFKLWESTPEGKVAKAVSRGASA